VKKRKKTVPLTQPGKSKNVLVGGKEKFLVRGGRPEKRGVKTPLIKIRRGGKRLAWVGQ